jgi:LacI family transcriptional regulator
LLKARGRKPTALVVANVNAAIGVLRAAHAHGIRVPDELSVVALHDVWFAEYSVPQLTVVRMPLYEMGYHGIRDLHHQMEGHQPAARKIVEPGPALVVRQSTASPPG